MTHTPNYIFERWKTFQLKDTSGIGKFVGIQEYKQTKDLINNHTTMYYVVYYARVNYLIEHNRNSDYDESWTRCLKFIGYRYDMIRKARALLHSDLLAVMCAPPAV